MEETVKEKENRLFRRYIFTTGFILSFVFLSLMRNEDLKNKVMEAVESENSTCPYLIDSSLRLDSVIALNNDTIKYFITMVNFLDEEIDTIEAHRIFDPEIKARIKTQSEFKIFRDNKSILNYIFRDKEGSYVLNILVTPNIYEK